MTLTATQQLTSEVLAWPGTSVRIGERGEYGFYVGLAQLGHLHGDRVAHFGFDRDLGRALREAGQVGPHPVNRHSPRLAARAIDGPHDVAAVRELLRLNYDRISPTLPGDEAQVRSLVAGLDAAQDDADAFCSMLTEDVVVVNFAGVRVRGREAFHAAMTQALELGMGAIRTEVEVHGVAFPSEDAAVVSATKRVHEPAGEAVAVGSHSVVAVRTAEGWRASVLQTTPRAES